MLRHELPRLPESHELGQCPQGHAFEAKIVAGSWIWTAKACSGCKADLSAGETRVSCKTCSYHLCLTCHGALATARQFQDVMITVRRAASFEGGEADAWQVQVELGGTVGGLKDNISELYGVSREYMVLRRDPDGEPLEDLSQHGCAEGGVLHLDLSAPMGLSPMGFDMPMGGPLDPEGVDGLGFDMPMGGGAMDEEGVAGLMQAFAGQAQQALEEELVGVEWTLTMVLRPAAGGEERRCQLTVEALSCVAEVRDMAHLMLGVAAEERLELEFAGERLPAEAPLHAVGLGDGDLVLVLPAEGAADPAAAAAPTMAL